MQIIATAPEHEQQQAIADYLRDELSDIERQTRTDTDIPAECAELAATRTEI
jgi:hypothetical protein